MRSSVCSTASPERSADHIIRLRALVGLTLLLWLGPIVQAGAATLIYSGNLDSELEPCGCSELGDSGGLKRRAMLLHNLRTENPQLVVISTGGLTKLSEGFSPIKHRFIREGMARLNYDAIGVQWADLAEGLDQTLSQPLPWVASNWRDGTLDRQRIIRRATFSLAFFQWLAPEQSPYRDLSGMVDPIDSDLLTLSWQLSKARAQGSLTVLGTTLTSEQAQEQLPLDLIDILLLQSAYEVYAEPEMLGNTLVLQPGSRGMRLGRLDFDLVQGQIRNWTHRVLSMPPEMPDAEHMADWYQAYNDAVKADYKLAIQRLKNKRTQQYEYVGADVCTSCHAAAVEAWRKTAHAHAFGTLERVKKDFDPECIACHVVGWGRAGGFIDTKVTPILANVQCENCHGPRAEHTKTGIKSTHPPADQIICGQCHNAAHSPEFAFDAYWPKIAH